MSYGYDGDVFGKRIEKEHVSTTSYAMLGIQQASHSAAVNEPNKDDHSTGLSQENVVIEIAGVNDEAITTIESSKKCFYQERLTKSRQSVWVPVCSRHAF